MRFRICNFTNTAVCLLPMKQVQVSNYNRLPSIQGTTFNVEMAFSYSYFPPQLIALLHLSLWRKSCDVFICIVAILPWPQLFLYSTLTCFIGILKPSRCCLICPKLRFVFKGSRRVHGSLCCHSAGQDERTGATLTQAPVVQCRTCRRGGWGNSCCLWTFFGM